MLKFSQMFLYSTHNLWDWLSIYFQKLYYFVFGYMVDVLIDILIVQFIDLHSSFFSLKLTG